MTPRPLSFVLALVLALPALATARETPEPWEAIEELRRNLVRRSPLRASFVQTYTPAGFQTGEEESGTLAVSLPECLRWDYVEPYPKSFLLCGETVHAWNEGEPVGDRFHVEAQEEPGLDFLLLDLDRLRRRYEASARRLADGRIEILLHPTEPNEHVAEARAVLDAERGSLESLSYEDPVGDVTRFEIRDYSPGAPARLFTPPEGVEWEHHVGH